MSSVRAVISIHNTTCIVSNEFHDTRNNYRETLQQINETPLTPDEAKRATFAVHCAYFGACSILRNLIEQLHLITKSLAAKTTNRDEAEELNRLLSQFRDIDHEIATDRNTVEKSINP